MGLNRTTNVDALRAGVRSGSIADIMFPADPVGNAPQLIQELARASSLPLLGGS